MSLVPANAGPSAKYYALDYFAHARNDKPFSRRGFAVIARSRRVRPEVAGPMTSSSDEAIQRRAAYS
jgi:hypothetical protein